ncbi:hypothetical protein TNCV_324411 [Trichonephila clavipes]|nr:hypothetical protein TNCV_324411 [Trichonephila clavipes]
MDILLRYIRETDIGQLSIDDVFAAHCVLDDETNIIMVVVYVSPNNTFIPVENDTVARQINDIAEDVEQQLLGKLHYKLFSIWLDKETDSYEDAH